MISKNAAFLLFMLILDEFTSAAATLSRFLVQINALFKLDCEQLCITYLSVTRLQQFDP